MKKAILLSFSLFLSACSLLPAQKEAPPLYILKGAPCQPSAHVKSPLVIHRPTSEASLDTHRIAMTLLPYHREYIENAEWSDHLPTIVQEVLLESLGERWGGAIVQRTEANLEAEYGLLSEIQDFSVYPLRGGHSEVRLKMNFKLIDFSGRRVVAAKKVCEVIPLKVFTVNAIVGAFNEALQTAVREVVAWVEAENLQKKGR